jgi:DNA-binding NtrC family response regulator
MTTGVTMTAARVSAPFEGAFDVRVTEGPDRGKHLRIDDASSPRLYVGRSSTCDLRLDDPHVSSRHLALELHGDELVAIDLGSRNRTSFGGVLGKEVVLLGHGERMVLGDTTLVVERKAEPRATPLAPRNSFGKLRGESREMRRVYPLLEKLAASSVPVLIEGETGTGKEILAESLHEQGPRAKRPFVVLDCTSVAPSVLESELFGHEKGAFTGAAAAKPGRFERAHKGTLFLDEVGEMIPSAQVKLLRVLQEGEFERLGGTSLVKVDVRVVAATNKDLQREVAEGRFREDLFYRLNVVTLKLPSLNSRREDIPLLAEHFLRQYCTKNGKERTGFTPEARALLEDYAWPGNVRELENAVERAVVLSRGEAIGVDDLPETVRGGPRGSAQHLVIPVGTPLEEIERRVIHETLRHTQGDKTLAAQLLGIAARTIYRKLEREQTEPLPAEPTEPK